MPWHLSRLVLAHACPALGDRRGIKAGDEVGQPLALDQDVVAQQLLGPAAVAGQDGVDDRLVLGERGRDPAACAQLQAAEGLQPIVQLAGLLGQIGVVARIVDDLVEALVGIIVAVGVPARRLLRTGFVGLQQGRRSPSVIRRAASARTPPRAPP